LENFLAELADPALGIWEQICTDGDAAFPRMFAKYVKNQEVLKIFLEKIDTLSPDVQEKIYTAGGAGFPVALVQCPSDSEVWMRFNAKMQTFSSDVREKIYTAGDAAFPMAIVQKYAGPFRFNTPNALTNFLNGMASFSLRVRGEIFGNADFSTMFVQYVSDLDALACFFKMVGECDRGVQENIFNRDFIEVLSCHADFATIQARLRAEPGNDVLISSIRQLGASDATLESSDASQIRNELRKNTASLRRGLAQRRQSYGNDAVPIVNRVLVALGQLEQWTAASSHSLPELQEANKLLIVFGDYMGSCPDAWRTGMEGLEMGVQLLVTENSNASPADQLAALANAWSINQMRAATAKISAKIKLGANETGNVEFAVLIDNVRRLLHGLPDNGAKFPTQGKRQANVLSAALVDNLRVGPGVLFKDVVALFKQEGEYRDFLKKLKKSNIFPLKYDVGYGYECSVPFGALARILMFVIWHMRTRQERSAFLNFATAEGVLRKLVPTIKKMPLRELRETSGLLQEKAVGLIDLASRIGERLSALEEQDDIVPKEQDQQELDELKVRFRTDPASLTLDDIGALHKKYGIDVSELLGREESDQYAELMSEKFEITVAQLVAQREAKPVLKRYLSTYAI
jgi:hypothetical protein